MDMLVLGHFGFKLFLGNLEVTFGFFELLLHSVGIAEETAAPAAPLGGWLLRLLPLLLLECLDTAHQARVVQS